MCELPNVHFIEKKREISEELLVIGWRFLFMVVLQHYNEMKFGYRYSEVMWKEEQMM